MPGGGRGGCGRDEERGCGWGGGVERGVDTVWGRDDVPGMLVLKHGLSSNH